MTAQQMSEMRRNAMRLLLVVVLFCAFCVVCEAQTVTKNFSNETLRNVITEVERQTNMSFVYRSDAINEEKRITQNFQNASIRQVLDAVLDAGTKYFLEKNIVVLYKERTGTEAGVGTEEPMQTVRGRVTDDTGKALSGVTVDCNGSRTRAVTDADGHFAIDIRAGDALRFTCIGYAPESVSTAQKRYLRVTLKADVQEIDDVVVVGYGSALRGKITGSVEQIKQDGLRDQPGGNVIRKLQGLSPALIVQQRSFNPNDLTTNLNIRGISTMNSNAPLIVIDGMVSSENSLSNLDPNDIEDISILKDAGAAAIYGSRSSNGCLLITTKKGRRNEPTTVRLKTLTGWSIPHIFYRPVDGATNAELRNASLLNASLPAEFTESEIQDIRNHSSEESWFLDQIFRTAMQQDYNVSVSGGSQRITYMISAGYFNQGSNYVGNDSYGTRRYSVRSNVSADVGRWRLNTILAFSQNNSLSTNGTSLERDASRVPPYYYYKMKENGRYLVNDILSEFNPLGSLEAGGSDKSGSADFTVNVSAEVSLARGLSLKGLFGANINGSHTYSRQQTVAYYTSGSQLEPARYDRETRKAGDYNTDYYMTNSQLLLNYESRFGRHSVKAMVGATNETTSRKTNRMTVVYSNSDLGTTADDNAYVKLDDNTNLSPEDNSRYTITSVLGRLNYDYADKYYGEFDFRYDASSKFAKGYRWGFFPSLSAGWHITEEPFMREWKSRVGSLKLRASYGVLGNQTIGEYDRFTTYNLYNYIYSFNNQSVTGAGFTLGSEELKWETTRTYNFGIDASFLNNVLDVTFDIYNKRTVDMLLRPVTPGVYGTQLETNNRGEMSNRGWELGIRLNIRTGKASHSLSANIGDSRNKLEEFPEGAQISTLEELWILRKTGIPISSYYGYRVAGIFQSEDEIASAALPVGVSVQPGDLRFVDRNGDNVIDADDRFVLGNAFPRYTFGFGYQLGWRGWDFGVLFNGVGKRDMMVRGELVEPFFGNYSYVIYKHQLDFWTPENTGAHLPRLTASGSQSSNNNYRMGSDIYIFNAAYVRMKNISIGYTLPQSLTRRFGVSKLRLYAVGQNLLTFSANSFIDPESSEFDNSMAYEGANTGCNYPLLKYVGFGVDIEF